MFSLKDKIFKYFGGYDKLTDSSKDVDGKGIQERYNESLATDYDNEIAPLIDKFIENLIVPSTMKDEYISYIENMLGNPVIVVDNVYTRKKVVQFANRIYDVKGTKKGHEILYNMLGITSVVILEDFDRFGFDSDTTFDSDKRTFDSACPSCTTYEIILDGVSILDQVLITKLFDIAKFNQPINAVLGRIEYNGETLPGAGIITIFVADGSNGPDGDLMYDNINDPSMTVQLIDGDLILGGGNSAFYDINSVGDLIYDDSTIPPPPPPSS